MITHAVRIYNERFEIVFSASFANLMDARNALVSRGYSFLFRRNARGCGTWVYEKAAVALGPNFTIPAERGVIEEL